jgi:hypothetical protein
MGKRSLGGQGLYQAVAPRKKKKKKNEQDTYHGKGNGNAY